MSLISGKEAWIAKSDKKYVQYRIIGMEWEVLTDNEFINWETHRFLSEKSAYEFRLKPQTITINGIEVPKPDYIVDTPHDYDGTWGLNIGGTYYLYKTEERYKQVVEALRSVFK